MIDIKNSQDSDDFMTQNRQNNLLDKYNELFERYLNLCKSKYDSTKPYENLEDCCLTCDRCIWELSGMLTLLEGVGNISSDKREEEYKRILDSFSSINLFNAYIEKGQVMVFSK